MEAFLAARKGDATDSPDKGIFIHTLEVAAARVQFDAVQMPLNARRQLPKLEQKVLPTLVASGTAVLGMKSMGGDFKSKHVRDRAP